MSTDKAHRLINKMLEVVITENRNQQDIQEAFDAGRAYEQEGKDA